MLIDLEIDGLDVGLDEDEEKIKAIAAEFHAIEFRSARDAQERLNLWKGRKGAFGAMGRVNTDLYVLDGVVPRARLEETLTLQGLGIEGALNRKLRSTHAIENLNSGIATYSKNVKRWQGGSMVVRWVSAAIVEAEKKFRRVQGWRDIKKLVQALSAIELKHEAEAKRVA